MMKQSLFDVLAQSQIVRNFEKSFPVATGFALKLQPAVDSAEIGPFGAYANPFCRMMARSPAARAACQSFFSKIREKAARTGAPSCAYCFARITHIAIPVIAAGDHVATVYGGQLLLEKPSKQEFRRISEKLAGMGLENRLPSLEQAWFRTPVISEKQFQAMIYLVENFAEEVSRNAASRILEPFDDEPTGMTRVRKFIHAHWQDPIKIADITAHLNVSKSTFSKMFKDSSGLTFNRYLTHLRVEKSRSMLADPRLKIREIAFQTGFESLSQFNRSFRQCTQMSPSEYRAMLEGAAPSRHSD